EAPSLAILPALIGVGAKIRAYDPEGMEEARKLMPHVTYCGSAYEAMEGADAVVVLTEWNQFRALDLERVKRLMRTPTMVDLRNIYDPPQLRAAGFDYVCIGRPVSGASAMEGGGDE